MLRIAMMHLLFNVRVVSIVLWVTIVHVCVLSVVESLVVCMSGIVLVLADLAVLSDWCRVLVILVNLLEMLGIGLSIIFDCLVVVRLVISLAITVLEMLSFSILMLWVAVVWVAVEVVVCMADSLKLMLRVVMRIASLFSVLVVADQRGIVPVDVHVVMRCLVDNSVMRGFMDNSSVMRSLVDNSSVMRGFMDNSGVMWGLVDNSSVMRSFLDESSEMSGLMNGSVMRNFMDSSMMRSLMGDNGVMRCLVDNSSVMRCCVMLWYLMRCLSSVMSINVVRVLMVRLL